MKRWGIVIGLAVVVLLALFWFSKRTPNQSSGAASPVPGGQKAWRQDASKPMPSRITAVTNLSPGIIRAKQKAAAEFLKSPVRDTVAARVMAKRLLESGYGIEHLRPVYMAAWGIKSWDPACTDIYRNDVLVTNDTPEYQRMRQGAKEGAIQSLIAQGVTDQALLEELLAIRPKAPWTRELVTYARQKGAPPPVEPTYSESDVIAYMDKTPVNDPAGYIQGRRPNQAEQDAMKAFMERVDPEYAKRFFGPKP